MTIGITGASGQLGRLAATHLLDVVDAGEVVLTSRTPESLSPFAARGVDIRAADFDDPSSLAKAFEGIDKLLLVSTDRIGQRLPGHLASIEAAVAAGVRHVVYTSVVNPVEANPALVVPDHMATEDALRDSGLGWTFLRNNLYAEAGVASLDQAAAEGRFVTNCGDGRTAYVTRADCAAAAVGVLTGPGHEQMAYDITGPQALSATDLATLAGPGVAVVQLDDAEFVAALVSSGLPEFVARLVASFGKATREGYLDAVTTAVHDLTGQQPTPLHTLAPLTKAPQS